MYWWPTFYDIIGREGYLTWYSGSKYSVLYSAINSMTEEMMLLAKWYSIQYSWQCRKANDVMETLFNTIIDSNWLQLIQ